MLRRCLCQTADGSPGAPGAALAPGSACLTTPPKSPSGSFNTAFHQGFGLCLTRFLKAPEIIKIMCECTTYHHHSQHAEGSR